MAQWYYTQNGQRSGPIDQVLLQDLVSSGHVGPSESAWQDGMPGWKSVSLLPELVSQRGYRPARDYSAYGSVASPVAVDPTRYAPVARDNAGFWLRVFAYIIDYLIVGVPAIFVVLFIFGTDAFSRNNLAMAPMLPYIRIGFGITCWLYFALLESSPRQATFGKRILGLRVADVDGQRIGFGRASVRHFAKIISGLICSIGYLMAGFTEQKQGLHDMIAGTFVVINWG